MSAYCMPDPGLRVGALASSNPHRGTVGSCPHSHHMHEDTKTQLELGRAEIGTKECPTSFLLGAKDSWVRGEVRVPVPGALDREDFILAQ